MPDLGLTPAYYGNPSATALSYAFDQGLRADLPAGVTYFDAFGFMHAVVANPGAFGFTDVTDPCLVGITPCSNPNRYLFGMTYIRRLPQTQFWQANLKRLLHPNLRRY